MVNLIKINNFKLTQLWILVHPIMDDIDNEVWRCKKRKERNFCKRKMRKDMDGSCCQVDKLKMKIDLVNSCCLKIYSLPVLWFWWNSRVSDFDGILGFGLINTTHTRTHKPACLTWSYSVHSFPPYQKNIKVNQTLLRYQNNMS